MKIEKKCTGFGQFERKCENPAGSKWTEHWCQRCDELRIAHISKRFDDMEQRFKEESPI